jgi:hypothetical protein
MAKAPEQKLWAISQSLMISWLVSPVSKTIFNPVMKLQLSHGIAAAETHQRQPLPQHFGASIELPRRRRGNRPGAWPRHGRRSGFK